MWHSERYTAVQRSQHLTQGGPNVFGRSYVANCSPVAGQDAFLGEAAEHRHIDYFQGLEQLRERGLPCELPAAKRDELEDDPDLRELQAEVRALTPKGATHSALNETRKSAFRVPQDPRARYTSPASKGMDQDRRVWKVLTRGKERAQDVCTDDLLQHFCLLRPEGCRLAKMIASDDPLSPAHTWQAIHDVLSLCTRDFTVVYLPGHEPVEGACPVACCRLNSEW
jgi:hypothetical protein